MTEPISSSRRWLRASASLALALLLAACAALPKGVERPPSQAIPASIDTELGRIVAASTPPGVAAGASGFRLLSWSAQ
jgi:hypothetical protein